MSDNYITEVVKYKTKDGAEFETKAQAEEYLHTWQLKEKIAADIYCRDTNAVEIAEWITNNLNFTFK